MSSDSFCQILEFALNKDLVTVRKVKGSYRVKQKKEELKKEK